MDQHPVPQNISSYEFRLVGDMTLKQFFQLAGGGVVGLIFFRSPFPFFIKYPLVFISVIVGILLAFVPLNGRPFSQWIMAFIKAIYSPTQYYWNPAPAESTPSISPPTLGGDQSGGIKKEDSPLDKIESQLFSKFTDLFESITHRASPPPLILTEVTSPFQPLPPIPAKEPVRQNVPPAVVTQQTPTPPPPPANPFMAVAALTPTISHSALNVTTPAQPDMSGLFAPTQPNILAGNVVDSTGQVIEGVILEIAEKDSGLPVRALRSNKLGQFQIATPLPNGEYVITCEKEGWLFDQLLINAAGQVIAPIQIRAKTIT